MQMPIQLPVLDFIVLAALLLFALLGARKGLVLSLCSLVAMLVAMVGASIITDQITPLLAHQAAPMIEGFLQENWDAILAGQAGEQVGFLWGFVRQALAITGLTAPSDMALISQLAAQIATLLLRPILFAIIFFLILILWFFISHALDLVAKLPVLRTLNTWGGLLFGAVEGLVLAVIAIMLIQAFLPELIPADWVKGSYLLDFLEKSDLPALF